MRGKKLALTTGMTLFEAENVINNFENNFRRLTRWQNEQREIGESTGILYNGFGRMMRIEPERAFTQSPALMGQSTARDLLMEGILRLWNMGGETVIRMIRAVVHDELVLSVHKNDVEEIEHLVVAAMSFPWRPASAEFEVQITAGLNKRGKDWADCYRK
jgi:DNA polymerase-1